MGNSSDATKKNVEYNSKNHVESLDAKIIITILVVSVNINSETFLKYHPSPFLVNWFVYKNNFCKTIFRIRACQAIEKPYKQPISHNRKQLPFYWNNNTNNINNKSKKFTLIFSFKQ